MTHCPDESSKPMHLMIDSGTSPQDHSERTFLRLALGASLIALILAFGCSSSPPPLPPSQSVIRAEQLKESATRYAERKQWSRAVEEWKLTANQYALLNQRTQQASALHNLGRAHLNLKQYNEAREALIDAANINLSEGQQDGWWRNQILLIQVDTAQGNTSSLDNRWNALLEEWNSPPSHPATRGMYLNELGLWQWSRNQGKEAEITFRQAYDDFRRSDHQVGQATALAHLASLLEKEQRYPEALPIWRQSLELFETSGHPPGIATALAGLGRTLLQDPTQREAAIDSLTRAARNFQELGMDKDYENALELLHGNP